MLTIGFNLGRGIQACGDAFNEEGEEVGTGSLLLEEGRGQAPRRFYPF
jgi:hypothetical protein